MEQKHISCGSVCDRLPTTSLKYPWFVARCLDAEEADAKYRNQCTFYELKSLFRLPLSGFPERRVRGCFHGWVIITHKVTWSLWNPVTSKTIRLPPLILKDGDFESIQECFLSSPPNDPTSVLMLTNTKGPTIVICKLCKLDRKRKRLRWKELTYAEQLRSINGYDGFLHCLTCYNGKVFALSNHPRAAVVQVDIVVKDKKDVLSLSLFGKLPDPFHNSCPTTQLFLKGYCEDLFYIQLDFYDAEMSTLGAVYLFKLDTTSMIWEEMEDLKNAFFYIDLLYECSLFYRDAVAPELGGYVHIFGGGTGEVIFSYDVEDKTIFQSHMSFLEQKSRWERELYGDYGEIECATLEEEVMVSDININNTRNEEDLEPHLLNIPFDVLKMIMELCVGVEYLNFRATCKRCQLAAPVVRWSNETSLRRLQTYSLNSPWLIVLDKHRGIITFTDPMFGDKYFKTTPQELTGDVQICYSRYGWLLLSKRANGQRAGFFFFNPFTNDIRKLPDAAHSITSLCFSHHPYSTDCVVVGLSMFAPSNVFIHIPSSSDHSWTLFHMDFGSTAPHFFRFPTTCDGDTYALNEGALHVFLENPEGNGFTNAVVAKAPGYSCKSCAKHFLVSCCDEHHLLLVKVDEVGKCVQVLKLNASAQEWEKIDSLGRHMIYICGTTCVCVEAKTPEMENKIYFPLLHSESGKIVFYSLETCRYHTFNGRNIQQGVGDFFGTRYHVNSHVWIQPSWS